jgi:group I intron endonuclease
MPKKIPKYSKGKIYGIRNNVNNKIYIGSTTELLSVRLSKHFYNSKKVLDYSLPVNQIGENNFYIELIEKYACNSKKELENIENFWIGFFIEVLGRENVYNLKIDGKNDEVSNIKTSKTLKGRFIGDKHPNFNRGSIYKQGNSYKFQYVSHNESEKTKTTKNFSFKKYGGEENALKEAEKFRDTIYPLS